MQYKPPEEFKSSPYRINIGDVIKVRRTEFSNHGKSCVFYKTTLRYKTKAGKQLFLDKNLYFGDSVDLPDNTTILIKGMYETGYKNSRMYNTVWGLMITDYEIVNDTEEEIERYNNAINANNGTVDTIDAQSIDNLITF